MKPSAFSSSGRFLRGNIHTHSSRSDGVLAPAAVCRAYRDAGYDFLCLSDHFMASFGFPIVDTSPFRTDDFTTIFGAEIHAPSNSHGEIWHLLACGLPLDFAPLAENEDAVALAGRAVAAGAFLGIAHPQWSGLSITDGHQMAGIAHAVEIWNTGCAVDCDRGDGTSFLDALLNDGHPLLAYASDDAHFRTNDAFGGWMMVKAAENDADALVAAMKRGDFYSSRGPTIEDVEFDGEHVIVRTSPVRTVAVLGRGSRSEIFDFGHARGVEARLPVGIFQGDWCRIVVMDVDGRQAWTNPVSLR